MILTAASKLEFVQRAAIPRLLQSELCITPTPDGILSREKTILVKPGTMLPDPRYPIFSLTGLPAQGLTHLFSYLSDSFKFIALFFIADHILHEPHPVFERFAIICKPYASVLRPVILARTYRVGGFRRPDWAAGYKNILFLSTNNTSTEKEYGLDGVKQMGLVIVRPDGYIAYSTLIDPSGSAFAKADRYLSTILLKH